MTSPTWQGESRERLQRQACEWISSISLDGASEADIAALQEWRDRSPTHAAAFAAASRTWRALDPVLEAVRHQENVNLRPLQQQRTAFGRRALLAGMVGTAAAA